jgi:lysyl-tRNA synthetase class 2
LIKELAKRSNELRSKFLRNSASKTGSRRSANLRIEYQGKIINLGKKWPVYKYIELFRKEIGLDYFKNSLDDFLKLAKEKNIEFNPKIITKPKIADEIFKKLIRPKLIEPSFLIDHPKELSPLAKSHPDDLRLTLRFQIYLAGFEIANAFAELNDPIDQKERFKKSAEELRKGDIEAHPYDETFISALEYGMPSTAGLGIGLDRLLAIVLNRKSIQDIIYFPFVKRKEI